MANLDVWSQNKDLFETTGARELTEQEIETMFDDKFFDNLESNDPLIKIEKQEIGWKVYFEKPDPNTNKIRKVWKNGVFVDKFFVSNETWNNIVNRRNGVSWAIQVAQTETQQLNENVTNSNTSRESAETQQLNQNERSSSTSHESVEWLWSSVEARADELLNRFDEFDKRPIPKRLWESHKTKERLKSVVRNDIAYLKSIKRELKRYEYTYDPEIFQKDLDELENHRKILEDVRQRIVRWDDTSNIPTILWSLRDVKRADKFENKMAKYNQKVNEILKDATLKRLWNEDTEWFQDYLEDVWSWAIEHPEQCRFYKQHERDFLYILSINPTLYATITTCQNPRRQNTDQYTQQCIAQCTSAWRGNWAWHCEKQKWIFDKWGEMFSDLLVTTWLIDENDTTKKDAWSKFGKVALLWLWAFAVYKIITTKKWERWTWIWWTAAVVLWMANKEWLYKWWNDAIWKSNPTPTEVMNYMNYQATWGTRPTSAEAQDILDNLISPSTTTISAIWDIDINDLVDEHIISTNNNWNFVFDYQKYKEYVENNVVDEKVKELNLQAGERLRDNPQWLHMWLAAMWITNMTALQELWEKDTTLIQCDSAWNYCENLQSPINAEISKEWFKPKDNASWYQIMYENNWKSAISRGNMARYIREGLIVPKDNSLALYINSPLTNLEHKCMTDCGNIRFGTYEELLKAVKLTEWIMTEFKGRTTACNNHPFHLWAFQPGNWLVWNIQFNDGVVIDTDVIHSTILKNTLKDISPALDDNKHTYVNYLNQLWNSDIQTVREKVDLWDYPMLNAMWIDFYNDQEAREVEEWLQDIKEWKKFSTWPISGQPFSVRWTFKNMGNSLVFTAVNGDREVFTEDISEKFPTLMNHKDKFLAFLNNPANNMWWSAIV